MNRIRNKALLISSVVILLLVAAAVIGAPSAPIQLTEGEDKTWNPNNHPLQQVNALAGNITSLTLDGISQTRGWQGYYGNVTGTITLDDANNFTFYNWTDQEPRGQIYASLVSAGTPTWGSVGCFNHTQNASAFHTTYGFSATDADNVTETYNRTDHDTFFIDSNSISGCPTTYIFRDDAYQQARFTNMLLWDAAGGSDGWIFGTIIENRDSGVGADFSCYHGGICDFQLLVAEDGHGTDTATTAYYFWVDLQG